MEEGIHIFKGNEAKATQNAYCYPSPQLNKLMANVEHPKSKHQLLILEVFRREFMWKSNHALRDQPNFLYRLWHQTPPLCIIQWGVYGEENREAQLKIEKKSSIHRKAYISFRAKPRWRLMDHKNCSYVERRKERKDISWGLC